MEKSKCARCGKEITIAEPSDFDNPDMIADPICDECQAALDDEE